MINKRFLLFAVVLLTVFCGAFAHNAQAAVYTVNQSGDAGDLTCDATCTLRDAVDDANANPSNDVINFNAAVTNVTLNSQIQVNNAGTLTINGNGANATTINVEPGFNRIFNASFAVLTIQGVTLQGGNNDGSAVYASNSTITLESVAVRNITGAGIIVGAVFIMGGTNHRIANSTISGNTGFADCAALFVDTASITIVNTTVSDNSTTPNGYGSGALCFGREVTATIRNSTISGNTANGTDGNGGGGGIYVDLGATVDLGNTIVAGNSAVRGADLFRYDGNAILTTSGGNLIGDNSGNPSAPNTDAFPTGNPNANGDKVGTAGSPIDPLLAPLGNYGGTTPTRQLLAGSPAIEAGINSLATAAGLTTDQRGLSRIVDSDLEGTPTVDSGAFEVQAAPTAANVIISGRVTTASGRGIGNVQIIFTDSNGNSKTAQTTAFGYYRFDDVTAGETVTLTVKARRFKFVQSTIVRTTNESIADADFVSE